MTRDEQLVYCRQCLKRKMNPAMGLICSLTGQKASFENECENFSIDNAAIYEKADDSKPLLGNEIQQKLDFEVFERLKMEQNLIPGILASLVVGIIGAILWGAITLITNYQIGYMAIGIGVGVGFAMRKFGNGIEQLFGLLGAGIALFSVVLGNFLSIIGFIANSEELGYIETLFLFDYSYLPVVMAETFSVMDILFYGFALYTGYKFSFRLLTERAVLEHNTK